MGAPIVDVELAVRRTRSGRADGQSLFNHWMDQIHKDAMPGATGGGGLFVFTAAQRDDDVQRVNDWLDGYDLPICGGHASGSSARVYLYNGRRGGLLSVGARTHTMFVVLRSAACAMRTCVVCEEWGAGAAAHAVAMRAFARAQPCEHFAHRLLAYGPPLEVVHAAFIVSCVGRGRNFHGGAANCESRALLAALAPCAPTLTGFFSQGEIGPRGPAEPMPFSHQFGCAVALFGTPARETDAERASRSESVCGFRECVCDSLPAGPWDAHWVHVQPFQPPAVEEAGQADADDAGAAPVAHG